MTRSPSTVTSSTVEAWATIVGLGDDDDELAWSILTWAMGIEGFDNAIFSSTYHAQPRSNRDSLPLLPGIEVLVDSLVAAGVPIGVASSSSLEWLDRHLGRLGLRPRFGAVVGADVVGGVGKPAPDVYLRACADLARRSHPGGRAGGLGPRDRRRPRPPG